MTCARRHAVALVGTTVLTAGLLTVGLPTSPAHAAEPDPAPLEAGVAWLAGELTDGLIRDKFGSDDYVSSVEVGLAMVEVGEDATAREISHALEPHVSSVYSYGVYGPAPDSEFLGTHVNAGRLGKAAVFAEAVGAEPTSYGGQDLIAQLEERVSDDPADRGRATDVVVPDSPQHRFDSDNTVTIGQSFAARALDEAGSIEAEAATEYLLAQQCEEGYFRRILGETAGDTCDTGFNAPSTDATAMAILNLQGQTDDTEVQAAVDDAVAWLESVQWPNGGFGSDGNIPAPKANSTGLAGRALGESGSTEAAEAAAIWIRSVQADDPEGCTSELIEEAGAIAYDRADRDAGRVDGIPVRLEGMWRTASIRALPALRWAPLTGTGEDDAVTSETGYKKAGSFVTVGVSGLAPADTVCFSDGSKDTFANASYNGQAAVTFRLPKRTGVTEVEATGGDGLIDDFRFVALGKQKFDVSAKKPSVRQGGTQKLVINRVAPGEKYAIKVNGNTVKSGRNNNDATIKFRFRVHKLYGGRAKVQVKGEFGQTRRGFVSFEVR